MNASLVVSLVLLLLAGLLCLPEVRAFLVAQALRRFFEDYMSRPRYRVYNLRDEKRKPRK